MNDVEIPGDVSKKPTIGLGTVGFRKLLARMVVFGVRKNTYRTTERINTYLYT